MKKDKGNHKSNNGGYKFSVDEARDMVASRLAEILFAQYMLEQKAKRKENNPDKNIDDTHC